MIPRLIVVIAVALVSACGGRTPAPSAPSRAPAARVPESNTSDDYVVGPFVTEPHPEGKAVHTYYIVRN